MFVCVLAVGVFLAGTAEALPAGWYTKETGDKVVLYDQAHEAVWAGYFDAEGNWHETTYSPKGSGSGDQGETMGGIKTTADSVLVEIAKPVAGIVVINASTQDVVFELRGHLEAGATVKIPANKLGDTVQLVATVDDKGATLDLAFFKRMGICTGKSSWISR
ncbi:MULTISPECIES: hypothetical protein [unclassified Corallococcus]|uniref:hypothetical protein n=1 Tax=unclassified Corallococcus TaxID=2685029 RepID=UPI001A8D47BF|nr:MULTISPECIES: hypothetical protein [unclassified Corallococcus]MBN9687420.1 hypothetical protein [Corallococcus sp. NCSPR001]WAS88759.1 hypothetical protein O0N60_17635 [Corallococcus sp. NCRR]